MKVKLLYPPLYYPRLENQPDKMFYRRGPAKIPLISLPILKSYLTRNGFFTEQDDLDIKTYTENEKAKNNKIWMSLFDNLPRIKRFLDTGSDPQLEEEAEKILKRTDYKGFDILGFSITNEWNIAGFGSTLVLAKMIKEKTGSITILGGSDVGQILNLFETKKLLKLIDIIFLRPTAHAHYDFLEVLKSLNKPRNKKFNKNALFFKDSYGRNKLTILHNKKLKINTKFNHELLTDKDIFPIPDFEGLPLELYKYMPPDAEISKLSKSKILVLPYYFSVGCPNSCIFCACSASKGFRFKNPELVADDLEILSSKNKTRFFVFYNTSINPTKNFVNEFIKNLEERDLNLLWSDCATVKSMDKKILDGLYKCGARRLIYGIESPSPRLLKYVNKGVTIGQISKILRLSHEVGIWNEVELVCGLPHENSTDIQQTLSFIQQNKEYINYYNLHQFKLVHSQLSLNPSKYGIKSIREKTDKTTPGKAFDEINGLKWMDKAEQIKGSFETIKNQILTLPNYGYTDYDECFLKLIYLYSLLKDKKEVIGYIKKNPFDAQIKKPCINWKKIIPFF